VSTDPGRVPHTSDAACPSAGRIAVVGREEVVAPFRAAGLETVPLEPGQAGPAVEALIAAGYAVVFYTADLAPGLAGLLHRYRHLPQPSLVELPFGAAGASRERVREVVRRAVGMDVFAGARPQHPGRREEQKT